MAAGGFNVWRSWDEPGGIRDELYDVARDNPQLVKLEVLGRTHQGRELIALKVTQGARGDARRIAAGRAVFVEPARARVDQPRGQPPPAAPLHRLAGGRTTRRSGTCSRRTELWFVIVREPRRLPVHVRRRAAVAQEPARQQRRRADQRRRRRRSQPQLRRALGLRQRGLVAGSGGRDLSRPERRLGARDARDGGPDRPSQAEVPVEPALVRPVAAVPAGLAGRHARRRLPDLRRARRHSTPTPAIPGFNPGQSADTLYVTNGETTDYADTQRRRRSRTRPSSARAIAGRRVRVPGRRGADPGGVREDAAVPPGPREVGARIPRTRTRRSGIDVEPFYLDQDDIDPQNGQQSLFDFKFGVSYGDPQEVRVLAKRSLGAVTLRYQVNGGAVQSGPTSEWNGGERYGPGNGDVLPRGERQRDRHRPGRQREGVVHRRRRDERLVHLRGRSPTPGAGCWSWRPRTTPAPRR